jgi:hypothetical protein
LIGQLGVLLMSFRDAFPRGASFHWFVIAVFGFIVRLDHHGVSSTIRWLRIRDDLYETFVSFFRSNALNISTVVRHWQLFVARRHAMRTLGGAYVLIGDGIKVAKEAQFMPGVKKLHQESENSGKASWIFGHHFGVIGILAGSAAKAFCIPLAAELHEGVAVLRRLQGKEAPRVDGVEKITIVTLMAKLLEVSVHNIAGPCVAVLDAFFAAAPMFAIAKATVGDDGERMMHVIVRAKNNVVVNETLPADYCGRGRRPKYGRNIKLNNLFSDGEQGFIPVKINVYGEIRTVAALCLDLFWKPLQDVLRFVLVKDGEHTFILICSDLKMAPGEIISLYAKRFKIEVTFKMLKHILGGFCYHFWTKAWSVPKGKVLSAERLKNVPNVSQHKIAEALNAIEAFVNIAMIAAGLLQLIAIEHAEAIQQRHNWWMRTYSSMVPSEEMVRVVIQHEFYHHFRRFKHTAIYRIIRSKRPPSNDVRLKEAA